MKNKLVKICRRAHPVLQILTSVSIQLVSPARGEFYFIEYCLFYLDVSIQLVSPARGELGVMHSPLALTSVSIQLVSPARGESVGIKNGSRKPAQSGFHSIGFPCERGVDTIFPIVRLSNGSFHSIGFPCERGVVIFQNL